MFSKICASEKEKKNVRPASTYRCKICKQTFQKFILFDGHFTFNAKCRVKYGSIMQCYVCGQAFCHLADLKYHFQRKHLSKKIINKTTEIPQDCTICQKRFATQCHLNEHIISDSENGITSEYRAVGKSSDMQEHQEKSQISNAPGNKDDSTRRHGAGTLNCEACNLKFTTKISLEFHQKLFHSSASLDQQKRNRRTKYACKICQAKFLFSSNLASHMRVHTIGEAACKICKIRFTKHSLTLHEKEAHPELLEGDVSEDESQKKENMEGSSLTEPNLLHRDQPQAIVKKTFMCNLCKKNNFQCHSRLVLHKEIHKGAFKCEKCQIPFTKQALIAHRSRCQANERRKFVDTKRFPCQCKICLKRYRCQSQLMRHAAIHKGAYKCDICLIPFTKTALLSHNTIHHSDIPRSDTKTSNSPKKLQTEVKIKTSTDQQSDGTNASSLPTKFECDVCGKECNIASNLAQHKRIHNSGNNKCSICKVNFTRSTIKQHEELCRNKKSITTPESSSSDKVTPKTTSNCKKSSMTTSSCEKSSTTTSDCEKSSTTTSDCEKSSTTTSKCKKSSTTTSNCKKSSTTTSSCEESSTTTSDGEKSSTTTSKCKKSSTTTSGCKKSSTTTSNSGKSSTTSFNCDKCDKSFTLNAFLQVHIKSSHRQYSCNICAQLFNTKSHLQNHLDSHSFECYVCKNLSNSIIDLNTHIKKHILYEQWVDPANVYLSNWSPEKSREILQNQPLVLVENLNIKTLNLNFSASRDTSNECKLEEIETTESTVMPIAISEVLSSIGKVEDENCRELSIVRNSEPFTMVECEPLESYQINIELKYSEQFDQQTFYNGTNKEHHNLSSSAQSADLILSTSIEEILTVEQADTTTIDDVIDVSSESEIDDIMELFHCYFCDGTFRSLDALGVHVKTCSFCP